MTIQHPAFLIQHIVDDHCRIGADGARIGKGIPDTSEHRIDFRNGRIRTERGNLRQVCRILHQLSGGTVVRVIITQI